MDVKDAQRVVSLWLIDAMSWIVGGEPELEFSSGLIRAHKREPQCLAI